VGARLSTVRLVLLTACLLVTALLAGCGVTAQPDPLAGVPRALLQEARPIGRGSRFQPPAAGPVIGRCSGTLGRRYGVHVELFAANRVVLVPAGIGTRPPRTYSGGRIAAARCFGNFVTIDPTGLILVRPGRQPTLSDLFRSWGQPLSARELAGFHASPGARVNIFIDGRRSEQAASRIGLGRHAEIVLEVGPSVPPHASYDFPPGT
jgi:hypothetical protein